MRNKIIILLLFVTIFQSSVFAADSINVENFLKVAISKNPEFERILIDELKVKYNKLLKIPSEELLMAVRGAYSLGTEESPMGLTLSKLFLDKGLRTNLNYDYTDTAYGDKNKSSIEVVQSIFRNAFGRAHKLSLDKIEKDDEIIKLQIIEVYEKYLYELLNLYYSWTLAYANLELAKINYKDSVALFGNIQEKRKSNIVSESDFRKAEIQMIQKKENLEKAGTDYKKYFNNIKQVLRLKVGDVYSPETDFEKPEISIDFLKAYQNFKQKSRTYRVLDLTTESSLLDLQLTKDGLEDVLNVSAGLSNYQSVNKGLTLGVYYEKAFFDPKNNAIEEVQKIEHDKNLIVVSNQKYDIETQLLNLYEDIMQTESLVKISEEKIKQMQIVVQEDEKYYKQGRISFNEWTISINQLEQYRYERLARILTLKTLILRWKESTDTLVKNNEVLKVAAKK